MRTPFLALSAFVAAAVLSCGSQEPQAPVTPSKAAVTTPPAVEAKNDVKPSVEKSALDPSTAPCDDFYQYACGGWIKGTQIPGDEASWYRSFSVIHERNEEILHRILEAYSKGENGGEPYAKALGDFYGSCMDEAAIEKAGTSALAPWLKAIDDIKDPTSLTKVFGRFQAELGTGVVFEEAASQDFGDATRVVAMITQSGLGMPDRDYYLEKTPKMTELRNKYEAHVAAMLMLAGDPEAKAKAGAKKVLEIETALAKASMTKEDRREPKKLNHPATKADLGKVAPGIQWSDWLEAAKSKEVASFNVNQPDFIKALGAMIGGKVSIADWKTYLRWQFHAMMGSELGKKFVDENFKWKQALTGAEKLPERWKRCVRAIDGSMGEALAQPFVKATLGASGKATVVSMVQGIEKAMHENLEKVGWMDDATRKAAFTKLGKIANKIAFPDTWRNYDKLQITRDSYLLNAQRSAAFEYERQLSKIGKPVDRTEWLMSPPTVNAYYDPQMNEMVFPAGILQPPFYSNAVARSTNFGGIGMVMGHELTHGFDDEGRQFDANGNLTDWWSKSVNEEFERRADCVKKQYDGYVVLGDLHVNGKLTLGENIADLGGLKLAYAALAAQPLQAVPSAPNASKPEFSAEQEFFLGFAQGWCGKMRDEALRHMVTTNPHAPSALRVNGPLSNLPEFAKAFSCKPDAKMVRKDRCEVW